MAAPRKGYENSCGRMKNSYSVTLHLSIPALIPSCLLPVPLFLLLDDAQMTHQSVQHMRLGIFVSGLWENMNVVCAVWDGSH